MSVERPTYMLAPNWDIPPHPAGSLTLGVIMKDPKNPLQELNKGNRQPVDKAAITTTTKKNWSFSRDQARSASFGLWTSVLAPILGVGADASVEASRSRLKSIACETLETQYFQPGPDYIAKSLKDPYVMAFIDREGKPVYMVTGVKIARKATVETGVGGTIAWTIKMGVDGTPMAVPVSVGPHAGYTGKDEVKEKFTASDDFVVAYQLIRIKPKGDEFKRDDYVKWALMSEKDMDTEAKAAGEELMANYDIEPVKHGHKDPYLDGVPTATILQLDSEEPKDKNENEDEDEQGKEYELVMSPEIAKAPAAGK